MTTLPTLPTLTDLTLDPTSLVRVAVSNPTYPEIAFHLHANLPEREQAIAETVASEVLRVEIDKVSHYERANTDMDVPDSTHATYGVRIHTYDPQTKTVGVRFHGLVDVRGVGQVGEARYRRLHEETEGTLDSVLDSQPNLHRKLLDLVGAAEARIVTDAARLEDIRTEAVNALVTRVNCQALADAGKKVEKGSTVKVVRGRKIPLGTTGKVIWKGESRFGWRVGIKDDVHTVHWTALGNVTAVFDAAEVTAAALAAAKVKYTETLAHLFGPVRD